MRQPLEHLQADNLRTNGRPTAPWSRLAAGRSDELGYPNVPETAQETGEVVTP